MKRKREIKKQIAELEGEIASLERKSRRSEVALIKSLVMHEEPGADDLEYFRVFNEMIDEKRDKIRELSIQLGNLGKH